MSYSKIIHAAMEAFKQNFNTICQNSGSMFDKLDDNSFKKMTVALMEAARCAGKAGLEQFLKQLLRMQYIALWLVSRSDTLCPKNEKRI